MYKRKIPTELKDVLDLNLGRVCYRLFRRWENGETIMKSIYVR